MTLITKNNIEYNSAKKYSAGKNSADRNGKQRKVCERHRYTCRLAVFLTAFIFFVLTACSPEKTAAENAADTKAEAAGQNSETAEAAEVSSGEILFTDSLGRTGKVPSGLSAVAVTGPLAEMAVYALAPEKLCGTSVVLPDSVRDFFPDEYLNLPLTGQLFGGNGKIDPEVLLAAGARAVIDVGEETEGMTELLDSLEKQTGLPVFHIHMELNSTGEAFRKLGELLQCEERAEELASYCEEVYRRTVEISEKAEKKKALYLLGPEGLHVIAKGSYHSEILDLLTDNAAVVDTPTAKGTGNETDLEQIFLWDPEVVLFAPQSIASTVSEKKEWKNLRAIAEGSYLEVPYGPYNWMGFPPSTQRFLGLTWLSYALYPDLCTFDFREEVKEYFRLFYHYELTDSRLDALTDSSLFR